MFVPFYKNGKWGFMDMNRGIVLCPLYDEVGAFSEGLAPVRIFDKWGYINENGEFVIEPRFDEAQEFLYGCAQVIVGGRLGMINRKGDVCDAYYGVINESDITTCWLRLAECLLI